MRRALPRPITRTRGSRRRPTVPALESMEPRLLLASATVVSAADDGGVGTLRWAILQVNADSVPGTINFAIPGEGAQVIGVSSPLPELTIPVQIDGTSQPGYTSLPLIAIDG